MRWEPAPATQHLRRAALMRVRFEVIGVLTMEIFCNGTGLRICGAALVPGPTGGASQVRWEQAWAPVPCVQKAVDGQGSFEVGTGNSLWGGGALVEVGPPFVTRTTTTTCCGALRPAPGKSSTVRLATSTNTPSPIAPGQMAGASAT